MQILGVEIVCIELTFLYGLTFERDLNKAMSKISTPKIARNPLSNENIALKFIKTLHTPLLESNAQRFSTNLTFR